MCVERPLHCSRLFRGTRVPAIFRVSPQSFSGRLGVRAAGRVGAYCYAPFVSWLGLFLEIMEVSKADDQTPQPKEQEAAKETAAAAKNGAEKKKKESKRKKEEEDAIDEVKEEEEGEEEGADLPKRLRPSSDVRCGFSDLDRRSASDQSSRADEFSHSPLHSSHCVFSLPLNDLTLGEGSNVPACRNELPRRSMSSCLRRRRRRR